jgi:hypothetical protein
VTHLALQDELLDAQVLRAVGAAPYGGADIGECLTAAAAGMTDGQPLAAAPARARRRQPD